MVITVLYTNGSQITEAFLHQLEQRGIRPTLQFSFDGVGHHDWLRGTDGVEAAVTDALRRCQQRGIGCPYSFNFTWTDYWIENKGNQCPCGGTHQFDTTSPHRICRKCRLGLDERGVMDLYDRNGREIP